MPTESESLRICGICALTQRRTSTLAPCYVHRLPCGHKFDYRALLEYRALKNIRHEPHAECPVCAGEVHVPELRLFCLAVAETIHRAVRDPGFYALLVYICFMYLLLRC